MGMKSQSHEILNNNTLNFWSRVPLLVDPLTHQSTRANNLAVLIQFSSLIDVGKFRCFKALLSGERQPTPEPISVGK